MNMPCEEWSWILSRYCSALSIYSSAARAMRAAGTADFNKAWKQSEEARKTSEGFRAALLEHEHRHGCQMARRAIHGT
jgi:2-methylcitrate dehydratase PrpD